jgi:hypothetical protein
MTHQKARPRATTYPNPAVTKTGATAAVSKPGNRHDFTAKTQHHQVRGLGKTRQQAARRMTCQHATTERPISTPRTTPFWNNPPVSKRTALPVATTQKTQPNRRTLPTSPKPFPTAQRFRGEPRRHRKHNEPDDHPSAPLRARRTAAVGSSAELGGGRNQLSVSKTANGNLSGSQNCLVWSARRSRRQSREGKPTVALWEGIRSRQPGWRQPPSKPRRTAPRRPGKT